MESMISFDDDIDVVIELTRHGVLTPGSWRFNYDGTIERMDEIGPTITWQDRGKSFKLFMRYEFERAIAAEDWGAVRVARPCIHTRFHVLQPMEHRQVLDEIETSIEDSLLILSFVSRQWVRSYETTLETQAHGEGATSHRSSVRRRIVPVTAPWDDFFLIETKELIEGGFDTLVKSLRSSPLREALSRAIAFEVASRDVHSLESTMVLCHAALEAVIGGLDDRNPAIDHSVIESKNVRDAIADAIKTVLAKFQVPDETSKSVLKKVPELERAPIADLVVHHTERLRVNTQDLWPDSIGFEQGLRAALKRRNALVHAATIEKPNEAYEDMMRLQILTERIILHALEWPAEKVSVYHDQPIRRLMHRR
jgi:hypothetical protein